MLVSSVLSSLEGTRWADLRRDAEHRDRSVQPVNMFLCYFEQNSPLVYYTYAVDIPPIDLFSWTYIAITKKKKNFKSSSIVCICWGLYAHQRVALPTSSMFERGITSSLLSFEYQRTSITERHHHTTFFYIPSLSLISYIDFPSRSSIRYKKEDVCLFLYGGTFIAVVGIRSIGISGRSLL